ncbi:uncharacterized protein LOC124938262 [Impatiens glandulifera]|uniref:uncharacterized protein LOC124938262 n=1 Tax=Impatiens glandulifera TaxID=253017 RepID=UPI001FB0D0C5|nr:uncharacterized protein LOC124938262 [Impatiens glandulifera]
MGCGKKLVDSVLFVFCLILAVVMPLISFQSALPEQLFPKVPNYLVLEKTPIFIGLILKEIPVVWSLCILNLFAIVCSKSWFRTACLSLGVTIFVLMISIMSDMTITGKDKEKIQMQIVYYPFMGFSVLAILRGLLDFPGGPFGPAVGTPAAEKKRT